MVECGHCGEEVSGRGDYCEFCGQPLADGEDQAKGLSSSQAEGSPDESEDGQVTLEQYESGGWAGRLLAAGVLGLVLIVGVGIIALDQARGCGGLGTDPKQGELEEALAETPTADGVVRVWELSKDADLQNAAQDTPEVRETWREFFRGHLPSIFETFEREHGVDEFCEAVSEFDEHEMYPDDRGEIIGECGDLSRLSAAADKARSEESSREFEIDSLRSDVDDLEEKQRELMNTPSDIVSFTGVIRGRLGPSQYEVSPISGLTGISSQRAVLTTTSTDFSTKGRFTLDVKRSGSKQVTLKNGRSVTWPHLVETVDTRAAQLMSLRSRIEDKEREIRRLESDGVDFDFEKVDRAREAVADAVDKLRQDEEPEESEAEAEEASAEEETEPRVEAEEAEEPEREPLLRLMDSICGREHSTKKGCSVCPDYTFLSGSEGLFELKASVGVELTSTDANERIVTLSGCGHHTEVGGTTVVVGKRQDHWERFVEFGGMEVEECEVLDLADGRNVAVCIRRSAGQGTAHARLFLISGASNGKIGHHELLHVERHPGICNRKSFKLDKIEDVRGKDVDSDGNEDLIVTVHRKTELAERKSIDVCAGETGEFRERKERIVFLNQDGQLVRKKRR